MLLVLYLEKFGGEAARVEKVGMFVSVLHAIERHIDNLLRVLPIRVLVSFLASRSFVFCSFFLRTACTYPY